MTHNINEHDRRPITATEWKKIARRDPETEQRLSPENQRQLADRLDQRDLLESNSVFWREP